MPGVKIMWRSIKCKWRSSGVASSKWRSCDVARDTCSIIPTPPHHSNGLLWDEKHMKLLSQWGKTEKKRAATPHRRVQQRAVDLRIQAADDGDQNADIWILHVLHVEQRQASPFRQGMQITNRHGHLKRATSYWTLSFNWLESRRDDTLIGSNIAFADLTFWQTRQKTARNREMWTRLGCDASWEWHHNSCRRNHQPQRKKNHHTISSIAAGWTFPAKKKRGLRSNILLYPQKKCGLC